MLTRYACTAAELSCVIGNIFAELSPPCAACGVDFLGFHTYLTESGAVIRKVRRRSKNNMKRKLKKLAALHAAGRIDAKTVEQSYQSWRGHAEKGNSYHLIRRTDQYYNSLMKTKEAAQCQKH